MLLDISQYYYVIGSTDYYTEGFYSKFIPDDFTLLEINKIISYGSVQYNSNFSYIMVFDIRTKVAIHKCRDEWFYVHETKETDEYGTVKQSYYKCDQFSGLIELLNYLKSLCKNVR